MEAKNGNAEQPGVMELIDRVNKSLIQSDKELCEAIGALRGLKTSPGGEAAMEVLERLENSATTEGISSVAKRIMNIQLAVLKLKNMISEAAGIAKP